MAGIDTSKLSASLLNNASLLPRTGGNVLSDGTLSQWQMLRANSKALKAAQVAEARGYLRDKDAPKQQLASEKYWNPADRSTTVTDILKQLGRKSAIETPAVIDDTKKTDGTATKTGETAATDTKNAASTAVDDAKSALENASGAGSTVDVEA